jgi:hypothetical protein
VIKVAYNVTDDPRGAITYIVVPIEGARYASEVKKADGTVIKASDHDSSEKFRPVTMFFGGWPMPGATATWAETEIEFTQRIVEPTLPLGAYNVTTITDPDDKIPTDRRYRDAWVLDGDKVVVDMPRARIIHLSRIRRARAKLFPDLDGVWMRETARGHVVEAARIEAERERLRRLPQTLDLESATTPDELHAIWPDGLDIGFRRDAY